MANEPTIASECGEWLERLEAMIRAMRISEAGEKRNMLMHYIAKGGRKLLMKSLENTGGDGDYTMHWLAI